MSPTQSVLGSPSSADSTTTSNVEAHSRAEPQRSGSHGRPQSSWQQTPRTAADALEPDPEKRKAELTKQVGPVGPSRAAAACL